MSDMRPCVLRGGPRFDGVELQADECCNIIELFADFLDPEHILIDEYSHDGYSEDPRIYNYIGQQTKWTAEPPHQPGEAPEIVDIFVDIETGDITAGHNG